MSIKDEIEEKAREIFELEGVKYHAWSNVPVGRKYEYRIIATHHLRCLIEARIKDNKELSVNFMTLMAAVANSENLECFTEFDNLITKTINDLTAQLKELSE